MSNNDWGKTMTKVIGLITATLGGLATLVPIVCEDPNHMWLGGGIAFAIMGLLFAFSESSRTREE